MPRVRPTSQISVTVVTCGAYDALCGLVASLECMTHHTKELESLDTIAPHKVYLGSMVAISSAIYVVDVQ